MDDIRSLLVKMLKPEFENKLGIVGIVKDVVGTLVKVESLEGGGVYHNIRLQAHPGNGVLLIPKLDSYVIIGRMNGGAGYIAMTSDLDSIQLLDGSYGGLIKIDELVNKLNVLEQRMGTHQHISTTVGSPTTPDLASNPIIPDTTVVELENDLITHGTVS